MEAASYLFNSLIDLYILAVILSAVLSWLIGLDIVLKIYPLSGNPSRHSSFHIIVPLSFTISDAAEIPLTH